MEDETSKSRIEREEYEADNGGMATSSTPTRKQKVKRHCARFWWIYAIAFACAVLVIVLPIVYVGYPNIAQKNINNSELDVTSQSILAPAPDAFELEQTTVFLSNSSLSADLASWTGDLCVDENCDYPFAQLQVPETKAANGTVVQVQQRTQIANMTEFVKYTNLTLISEEYSIYLKGKGGLSHGGLPSTTVNYNKKITMKGLNGLAGFAVTDLGILTTALPDGTNTNGTVHIPNPSVSTYEMGNLTMSMSVGGMPIGVSTLRNVVLAPGNNTFPMTAVTNQTAVVGLILQGPFKDGIVPVDIVGNTTVYHGQHIPWYEEALGSLTLTTNLNVMEALQKAGLAGYLGLPTGTNSSSTPSSTPSATSSATL